jgi:MoaA/NifB/PqqE/SkfB family radical SAM enzyme
MDRPSRKTVAFTPNAANIFFHILTRCNLHCGHCYINPEAHGSDTLPLETVTAWLAAFADRSRRANVIFLGGEPTLHPKLPEAVGEARRLGFASVTVDTNGYLFHDFLHRVRPADLDYLSFSLDGASREVNDAIRGAGCFDRCLLGVRQAVAAGFTTSMIYTVSAANLHELQRMPALVRDLGIRRFFIQVIGIRGKPAQAGEEGLQVTYDQWRRTVPPVAEAVAAAGIPVVYPRVFLEEGEPFACAGRVADNYFVFPNGRVYRCPLCEDHPLHALEMVGDRLAARTAITEADLFSLDIPEGCVMNKLVQPGNIEYRQDGTPAHRIACCLLKEEVSPPEGTGERRREP